jgi:hypothetical protein
MRVPRRSSNKKHPPLQDHQHSAGILTLSTRRLYRSFKFPDLQILRPPRGAAPLPGSLHQMELRCLRPLTSSPSL